VRPPATQGSPNMPTSDDSRGVGRCTGPTRLTRCRRTENVCFCPNPVYLIVWRLTGRRGVPQCCASSRADHRRMTTAKRPAFLCCAVHARPEPASGQAGRQPMMVLEGGTMRCHHILKHSWALVHPVSIRRLSAAQPARLVWVVAQPGCQSHHRHHHFTIPVHGVQRTSGAAGAVRYRCVTIFRRREAGQSDPAVNWALDGASSRWANRRQRQTTRTQKSPSSASDAAIAVLFVLVLPV
jgi:hypothetical protein